MWETFFHVSDRDLPFLALIDSSKKIVWYGNGAFSQQVYSTLQQEIQKLLH